MIIIKEIAMIDTGVFCCIAVVVAAAAAAVVRMLLVMRGF
jgi:hypothetical protein